MAPLDAYRRHRALLWALGVVVLIAAGVAGALIANAVNSPSTAATPATTGSACDVTSVAGQELPSVVTIFAGTGASAGVGSGEVVRSDGYVLTNNHVILPAVAAGGLQVVFDDGTTAAATITGRDPLTDLAVIRVSGKSNLRTISVGNSSIFGSVNPWSLSALRSACRAP